MIGMRMIETHNFQAALVGLPLDRQKFLGIDVVTVLRTVGAGVAATDHIFHHPIAVAEASQKRAAALEWVRLLAVPAQRLVLTVSDDQHERRLPLRNCAWIPAAARPSQAYFGA